MDNVSGLCWYAVYTRARWEKRVGEFFEQSGFEYYLPMYRTLREWSDRRKRVTVPLFPSYLFVRIKLSEYQRVVATPGVARIICFEGKPVPIPESQIDAVKMLLSKDVKIETPAISPEPGDEIEITKGSLKGLKGEMVEYRGKRKIIIRLDAIDKSVVIHIPPSWGRVLGVKRGTEGLRD